MITPRSSFLLAAVIALQVPAPLSHAQGILDTSITGNWSLNKSELLSVHSDQTATLLAGGILSHAETGPTVFVTLVSTPFFGDTSESWQTLQVGAVTLTFVRSENGGGLVLVGDQALQLPSTIALNDAYFSDSPVDLTLGIDRALGIATLMIEGALFNVTAKQKTGRIDVILDAGAMSDWSLNSILLETDFDLPGKDDPETGSTPSTDEPSPVKISRTERSERKKTLLESKAFLQSKNYDGAQASILKINPYPEGSFRWNVETASGLTRMALTLRQNYDYPGAMLMAQRALTILRTVESLKKSTDEKDHVAAHALAAFLLEELLHDEAAARTEYQKALRADPQSARAAQGLERLDERTKRSARVSGKRG